MRNHPSGAARRVASSSRKYPSIKLLPRSAISPKVRPSAGTSVPSGVMTRGAWLMTFPTPCRALSCACSAIGNVLHSLRQSQITTGPKLSVSPYKWVTSIPRSAALARMAGVGAAPPVPNRTTVPRLAARCQSSIVSTVGAPHRWVTPESRR